MTTYYYSDPDEALKRAKAAGKATWLLVVWDYIAQRKERVGSLQGREGGGDVCGDEQG